MWSFSDDCTIVYVKHHLGQGEAKNDLSDTVSKDLKRRGFKYLGSVTVYAHLQACGMINDHAPDCYKYRELLKEGKVKFINE